MAWRGGPRRHRFARIWPVRPTSAIARPRGTAALCGDCRSHALSVAWKPMQGAPSPDARPAIAPMSTVAPARRDRALSGSRLLYGGGGGLPHRKYFKPLIIFLFSRFRGVGNGSRRWIRTRLPVHVGAQQKHTPDSPCKDAVTPLKHRNDSLPEDWVT